jgi:hypothetical protein
VRDNLATPFRQSRLVPILERVGAVLIHRDPLLSGATACNIAPAREKDRFGSSSCLAAWTPACPRLGACVRLHSTTPQTEHRVDPTSSLLGWRCDRALIRENAQGDRYG